MAKNPKGGWYADPANPGRERFWSGSAWTGDEREAPPTKKKRRGGTAIKVALGIVLGVVILVAGCAALLSAGLNSTEEGGITRAQFDAVPQGAMQTSVEADLGKPDSSQAFEQNIPEIQKNPLKSSCIYYPEKGKKVFEGSSFQLCFDNGKLTSKNVY